MSKQLLISGHQGYIGSYFCKILKKKKIKFTKFNFKKKPKNTLKFTHLFRSPVSITQSGLTVVLHKKWQTTLHKKQLSRSVSFTVSMIKQHSRHVNHKYHFFKLNGLHERLIAFIRGLISLTFR